MAIACACGLARPNTFSVGRPATTSRKCPAEPLQAAHLRVHPLARAAPTSAMNSGISGTVTITIAAETQSRASRNATTTTGAITASTTCGR